MARMLSISSVVVLLAAAAQAGGSVSVLDARAAARAIKHADGPRLIFLWEATCGPCRRVFPEVERVAAEIGSQGAKVFSFSLDEQAESLDAFLEEQRSTLSTRRIESGSPEALDEAMREVGIQLGASFATPLFAVLDGDGRLLGQGSGSKALFLAEQWLDQAKGRVARGR